MNTWIEMGNTYLKDGPPKRPTYAAYLFINRCEVRNGNLTRKGAVVEYEAATEMALEALILQFMEQDDVRLLADGIDANNITALPRRTRKIPEPESRIYQLPGDGEKSS